MSNIVKGVKRAMAGEYSRELSTKVFKGQCRLIELGYRQGGTAGYGLRRRLIDAAGESKGQLTLGEQKSIHTDRVILVPGPPEEQAIVRRIYKAFIEDRRNEREIADELNRGEILTERGGKWSRALVHEILTNEKYIGNNILNSAGSVPLNTRISLRMIGCARSRRAISRETASTSSRRIRHRNLNRVKHRDTRETSPARRGSEPNEVGGSRPRPPRTHRDRDEGTTIFVDVNQPVQPHPLVSRRC